MKKKRTKVAVGLSGGVDSSLAAALLRKQDYEVFGVTMEIYDGSAIPKASATHACYGPVEKEDVESAAAICENRKACPRQPCAVQRIAMTAQMTNMG